MKWYKATHVMCPLKFSSNTLGSTEYHKIRIAHLILMALGYSRRTPSPVGHSLIIG